MQGDGYGAAPMPQFEGYSDTPPVQQGPRPEYMRGDMGRTFAAKDAATFGPKPGAPTLDVSRYADGMPAMAPPSSSEGTGLAVVAMLCLTLVFAPFMGCAGMAAIAAASAYAHTPSAQCK